MLKERSGPAPVSAASTCRARVAASSSCSICSRAAGNAACAWVSSRRESRPAALRSRVRASTCSRSLSVSRATFSCRLSSCSRAYTCAILAARVRRAACDSTSAARSRPSALSYAARFLPQKSTCQDKVAVSCATVSQLPANGAGNRPCSEKRPRAAWPLESRIGVAGAVDGGNLRQRRARARLGDAQARIAGERLIDQVIELRIAKGRPPLGLGPRGGIDGSPAQGLPGLQGYWAEPQPLRAAIDACWRRRRAAAPPTPRTGLARTCSISHPHCAPDAAAGFRACGPHPA